MHGSHGLATAGLPLIQIIPANEPGLVETRLRQRH